MRCVQFAPGYTTIRKPNGDPNGSFNTTYFCHIESVGNILSLDYCPAIIPSYKKLMTEGKLFVDYNRKIWPYFGYMVSDDNAVLCLMLNGGSYIIANQMEVQVVDYDGTVYSSTYIDIDTPTAGYYGAWLNGFNMPNKNVKFYIKILGDIAGVGKYLYRTYGPYYISIKKYVTVNLSVYPPTGGSSISNLTGTYQLEQDSSSPTRRGSLGVFSKNKFSFTCSYTPFKNKRQFMTLYFIPPVTQTFPINDVLNKKIRIILNENKFITSSGVSTYDISIFLNCKSGFDKCVGYDRVRCAGKSYKTIKNATKCKSDCPSSSIGSYTTETISYGGFNRVGPADRVCRERGYIYEMDNVPSPNTWNSGVLPANGTVIITQPEGLHVSITDIKTGAVIENYSPYTLPVGIPNLDDPVNIFIYSGCNAGTHYYTYYANKKLRDYMDNKNVIRFYPTEIIDSGCNALPGYPPYITLDAYIVPGEGSICRLEDLDYLISNISEYSSGNILIRRGTTNGGIAIENTHYTNNSTTEFHLNVLQPNLLLLYDPFSVPYNTYPRSSLGGYMSNNSCVVLRRYNNVNNWADLNNRIYDSRDTNFMTVGQTLSFVAVHEGYHRMNIEADVFLGKDFNEFVQYLIDIKSPYANDVRLNPGFYDYGYYDQRVAAVKALHFAWKLHTYYKTPID